jgi:glycosyltransferase involved in cell wall biosynthesis
MRLAVPRAGLVWGIRGSRLDFKAYPLIVRAIFHLGSWFAGAADIVISNSFSGAADHIAVGYPEDRMRVIPNGIDTEHFHPDQKARAQLREGWHVRENAPLIGIVGRIAPMKDHPTFLHAAAIFAQERPEARFVCVGNGSPKYLESMLRLTGTLGLEHQVKWLPAQAAIRDTYNALDLLTSSSSYGEGFSNVIGEAMSCGIRCVVTDVGDSARIVGCTGIVVPPSNPLALAEGWRRAFDEFREADRSEPRQRIELEFSLKRLLDRTEAVLGDLVAQGSRV